MQIALVSSFSQCLPSHMRRRQLSLGRPHSVAESSTRSSNPFGSGIWSSSSWVLAVCFWHSASSRPDAPNDLLRERTRAVAHPAFRAIQVPHRDGCRASGPRAKLAVSSSHGTDATHWGIEVPSGTNGRRFAEILELAGVLARGSVASGAMGRAEVLVLRVVGVRVEHGEALGTTLQSMFPASA